jgi:hypothetical protein
MKGAMTQASVFVNGGQRGLQIELEPNDARKVLDAIVRPLTLENIDQVKPTGRHFGGAVRKFLG